MLSIKLQIIVILIPQFTKSKFSIKVGEKNVAFEFCYVDGDRMVKSHVKLLYIWTKLRYSI